MSKPNRQPDNRPGDNATRFETVLIEISGTCNAKCPWCITGCGGHPHGGMMSRDDFRRCVERLEALGVIRPGSTINLYSWGEPTLNRNLDDMLAFLGQRGLRGEISTNAIKPYLPTASAAQGLAKVMFSVSGITDRSEMRMHGVPASRVLDNIEAMLNHLRGHGWQGAATMSFHIYQHNVNEGVEANDWCDRHGVKFAPYFAYFNNFHMAEAYLAGHMERSVLMRVSKELMLFYVDDLIAQMPPAWSCTLRNKQLVIDEKSNVRTCCALPNDHGECVLGSIFDLDLDDIQSMKDRRRVCNGCEKSGSAWWATHVQGGRFFEKCIEDHQARMKIHRAFPLPVRRLL